MSKKILTVVVISLSVFCIFGCGGGGGGGGAAGPDVNTTVTLSGNVTAPELNDALLANVRGAAGAAINYSNLSIHVTSGGTADSKNLSADGSFASLQITSLTSNSVTLEVRTAAGHTILARKLSGLSAGQTLGGIAVNATTTANLLVMQLNGNLSENDLDGQKLTAQYQTLITNVLNFLKNTVASSNVMQDNTVSNAAQTANAALYAGEKEIKDAYTAMKNALENTSLTAEERVSAFMNFIHPDFKDQAGNTDKYDELRDLTLSRLGRYDINSYSFTPGTVTYSGNDIVVATSMFISVSLKPGATGGYDQASVPVDSNITWKRVNVGGVYKWLLYQGLPYKSSEITI